VRVGLRRRVFEYTAIVPTRFRRFLLMFLVLALPMQAWASASMLDCALGQQQTERVAVAEHGEHCHEADSDAPVPEQHDCQHCSACMLGATLPPPTPEVTLGIALSGHYAPGVDAAVAAFIPDGPERPPRSRLA
jgi:hypothetical protein